MIASSRNLPDNKRGGAVIAIVGNSYIKPDMGYVLVDGEVVFEHKNMQKVLCSYIAVHYLFNIHFFNKIRNTVAFCAM